MPRPKTKKIKMPGTGKGIFAIPQRLSLHTPADAKMLKARLRQIEADFKKSMQNKKKAA